MAEQGQFPARRRYLLLRTAVFLLVFLAGGVLAFKLYLLSPLARRQLDDVLSRQLGQPVTVDGLRLSVNGITLNGVKIGNPPGFDGPPLLAAGSVRIVPNWAAIATGHYRLTAVRIAGLRISLVRDRAGDWNFSGISRRPKKPGVAPELLIDRLELADAACSVAGRQIEELSATVTGLATRGSQRTAFTVSGTVAGTKVSVSGGGRLGPRPDLAFAVDAPDIVVPPETLGAKGVAVRDAVGFFRLAGTFADAALRLDGRLGLHGGTLVLKGSSYPVSAELTVKGEYRVADDTATLERLLLTLSGRPVVEGRGTVAGVRGERRGEGALTWRQLSLAELFTLVPAGLRRDLAVSGTLVPGTLHLAGNRRDGVTSCEGRVTLDGVGVTKGKRLLVQGVTAAVTVDCTAGGWGVGGTIRSAARESQALLGEAVIPARATFSRHFALQSADIQEFTARIAGTPVTGNARYRPDENERLRISLHARPVTLRELGQLFPGQAVNVRDGRGDVSLQVSGRSLRDCAGTYGVRVTGLAAEQGGRRYAASTAAVEGSLTMASGVPSAAGTLHIDGGVLAGTPLTGSTRFRYTPAELTLSALSLEIAGNVQQAGELVAAVPKIQRQTGETIIPLSIRWNGLLLNSGRYRLADCRGELHADLHQAGKRRWLVGKTAIPSGNLLIGGVQTAKLSADGALRDGELSVDLAGTLLDGNFTGNVRVDPFAVSRGISWRSTVTGADLPAAARVFVPAISPWVEQGSLNLQWTGSYRAGKGITGPIRLAGRDISLHDPKGKGVLTDGALLAALELADGNLSLREGQISVGPELKLAVDGSLQQVFSPQRAGAFHLSAGRTGLNALLDAFANRLPRVLQESAASGDVAAETTVRIDGRAVRVDGTVTMHDGVLDIPGQKFTVSGASGTIPFSVAPAGQSRPPSRPTHAVSRDNMPLHLTDVRQRNQGTPSFRIAALRFGPMELTDLRLIARAKDGLTEVTSLSGLLFDGRLYGSGFFRPGGKERYGADLFLDDVSLRRLCDAFPPIRGYISGRLDGIVSLAGTAPGVDGLAAFIDLWTRSGPGEKMLVSKEFLQKLAGRKLKGFFFRSDRPYDRGEISATLEDGVLTFHQLDLAHTNLFGVKDLSVAVAEVQNQITLEHLLSVVKEAASRGKAVSGGEAPVATEFKWQE